MVRHLLTALVAPLLVGLVLSACGGDGDAGGGAGETSARREAVLDDLLRRVIRPELQELGACAEDFARRCDLLRDAMEPTRADSQRLEETRASWRALRAAWRRNEVWMIGPVAEALWPERFDAPVDTAALAGAAARLADVEDPAVARRQVAEAGAGVKSLAALATLLFAAEGGPDAGARRLLAAAARENAELVAEMIEPWIGATGALALALREPQPGRIFETPKEAVDALVKQAVVLAMRHRDEDLAPLVGATARGAVKTLPPDFDAIRQRRRDLVESYLGLQQLYLARHAGENGRGLSHLVSARSANVDRAARASFERAVAAMAALPEDLRAPGDEAETARRRAYDAATLVKAQLGTSVVGILDTTLGFALADGD